VLWTILGFLDLRTLRTARLVCRQFRESASGHLKALQLNCSDLEQPYTGSLTRLSGLKRLTLVIEKRQQLHLLAEPGIAPFITHVRLGWECFWDVQKEEMLSRLMLLPMLLSLTLPVEMCNFELLPIQLEELHLPYPVEKDVSSLTRFRGLTTLGIVLSGGPPAGQSLGTLTCLRSLRSLTICCGVSASLVLGRFTMLTSLAWNVGFDDQSPGDMFLEMAHLTGLSELRLSSIFGEVRQEHLACLSPLTELTCLGLNECDLADDVAGSGALMPLTPLVSLQLTWVLAGLMLLPALKLESLQSLALSGDEGDISVLGRATGLTHLEFECWGNETLVGLEATLAGMSQLRSLSLTISGSAQALDAFHLSTVLRALTGLTQLRYKGHHHFKVGADMTAIAALPGLQSLHLTIPAVTPVCLPALQAMSGLTELILSYTGIRLEHFTPEDKAAFNVERDRRGWPRLKLEC
jgi:hypothetical protein